MLSSFVEHGHDDGDASCLAADCADGAFEVRVVIVGAHHIVLAVHLIGQTVVEHIADDEDIVAANGLLDVALRFARTETRECRLDEVGVALIARERDGCFVLALADLAPCFEIGVDLCGKLLTAGQCDERKRSYRNS